MPTAPDYALTRQPGLWRGKQRRAPDLLTRRHLDRRLAQRAAVLIAVVTAILLVARIWP